MDNQSKQAESRGKQQDQRRNYREDDDEDDTNQDADDNNKKDDGKRYKKRTFADITKGKLKCEVRNSKSSELSQKDFNQIGIQSMYKVLNLEAKGTKTDWSVQEAGISQMAIWYTVNNQTTVDTMRLVIPSITPPEIDGKPADYMYVFFGPGEQPFRYMRWRIPVWWSTVPFSDIENFARQMNPALKVMVNDGQGGKRYAAFKLKNRVKDRRDKIGDDKGMMSIQLEVEEVLWRPIIDVYKGKLRLGINGECMIEGGGVQAEVRAIASATLWASIESGSI